MNIDRKSQEKLIATQTLENRHVNAMAEVMNRARGTAAAQKLQSYLLITYQSQFHQMLQPYKTFGNAMQEKTMTVPLSNDP
jgi:hypothetical protein